MSHAGRVRACGRGAGAGSDPSISHLILARGKLKYARVSATTDSDLQYVRFHEGQSLVVYLLWAGKEPTLVPGADVARSFRFGAEDVQKVRPRAARAPPARRPRAAAPPRAHTVRTHRPE